MADLIALVITALATLCVTHRYFSLAHFSENETIHQYRSRFASLLASVATRCVEEYSYVINRSLKMPKAYQIKHVFLIDRESGMHVEAVSSKYEVVLDSDAVSAMLSAIQSFVQDAFSQDKSSKLTDFRVGDHSIWVAHGPKLMLVCVIVGEVPKALKAELDQTLKIIQSEFVASASDMCQQENINGVTEVMRTLMASQK